MLRIKRINDEYFREINDFQCGIEDESMEIFLKCEALRCDENGEGNTFLILSDKNEIIGYYTIKCNGMNIEENNMEKVFPVIEISRLAVDYKYRKNGYGTIIMNYILNEIYKIKKDVGVKYILLFSIPSAINFYKDKFNFLEIPNDVQVLPSWDSEGCQGMYAILDNK